MTGIKPSYPATAKKFKRDARQVSGGHYEELTVIKLVISDLDGTFLNSQGGFDQELYAEVSQLMQAKGVQFAACTGKQCERVEELFGDAAKKIWILGDSATRIKRNGEFVYQSLIDNSLGLEIINTLHQVSKEHVVIACTSTGAVIRQDTPPHLAERVRKSYTQLRTVDDLNILTDDFVKITVYDEAGTCPQTRPHLVPFENKVYIVVSEAAWIDIADYGVHKGATIRRLQEILNISRQETMAFGDGYNDIELLAEAEYSFAMRNAFDKTKAAANFITRSNDENAVLHTIKHLLQLQS